MNQQLAAQNTITQLQTVLENTPCMRTEMNEFTDHFFAPGVYLRTLFIPAGFVLVGKAHVGSTLNILLKGKISIMTSKGEKLLAEAPCIFTASAGQKAGFAITDVWYANIFPNPDNITDIDKLVEEHTVTSLKTLEVVS